MTTDDNTETWRHIDGAVRLNPLDTRIGDYYGRSPNTELCAYAGGKHDFRRPVGDDRFMCSAPRCIAVGSRSN